VNSRSGYYLSVPSGWVLTDSTDYHAVKLTHTESGATFSVLASSMGTADLQMLYTVFAMSLKPPEWYREPGGGDVTLGNRPAIEMRGTHLRTDGVKFTERIVLTQDGSLAYTLTSSVPQAAAEARAVDIDRMLSSFAWGKPPKTRATGAG
jgi:hypothetical protein